MAQFTFDTNDNAFLANTAETPLDAQTLKLLHSTNIDLGEDDKEDEEREFFSFKDLGRGILAGSVFQQDGAGRLTGTLRPKFQLPDFEGDPTTVVGGITKFITQFGVGKASNG